MRKSKKSRSRKSRRRVKARRRNPVFRRKSRRAKRPRRASARRRNPVFRRKAVRRRRRSNPGLSLKSAFNKQFIMGSLLTAGGFVAGIKGTKYLLMIPGLASMNRFVGIIHLLLGGLVAAKVKNPKAKALGAGIAAAGAFDLIAKNVAALGLPTLLGMDDEVAGDEYMGETYLPGHTEILGETYVPGSTEVLGEEYAGASDASDIYASY